MKWNKNRNAIFFVVISVMFFMCSSSKQLTTADNEEKKNVDQLLEQNKTDEQKKQDEDDVLKLLGISPKEEETKKDAQQAGNDKEIMEKQANELENQLKNKDTEISKLKTDLNDSNQRLTQLENVLNDLKSKPTAPPPTTVRSNQRITQTMTVPSDYKGRYEVALSEYRRRNYNSAIRAFEELLNIDTSNSYSDNCQYWIGESYYGLMMYQRAITEFEKVFAFVNSNKEDAAQLKIGLCYKQLNQREDARDVFQRFLMKYPDSEFVNLVRRYLSEL